MNKNSNIFKLDDLRERQKAIESSRTYSKYIKTLSNAQLEAEINFLLKSLSNDADSMDSYKKGELIIKEISQRVDPITKQKIQKLTQNNSLN